MKTTFRFAVAQTILYVAPLALYLGAASITEAKDPGWLSFGFVRAKTADRSTAPAHGSLSVNLESNELSAWYFPQSFYSIYTTDGKLVRNVTAQVSSDEQIPDVIRLAAGNYIVAARSDKDGSIRLPVTIKAGEQTRLDIDLRGNN
jgi:SOS-response transcriptional repressor LexA